MLSEWGVLRETVSHACGAGREVYFGMGCLWPDPLVRGAESHEVGRYGAELGTYRLTCCVANMALPHLSPFL